jgi:hypothetical protein
MVWEEDHCATDRGNQDRSGWICRKCDQMSPGIPNKIAGVSVVILNGKHSSGKESATRNIASTGTD